MSNINILSIDLNIIRENIRLLKSKIGGSKFFAVIKANAYGMGAIEVGEAIDDLVDGYCTSCVEEAIELRNAGLKKDILILGFIDDKDYDLIERYNLTVSIYNMDFAKSLDEYFKNKSIKGHIKLDTGHGRLGFQTGQKSIDEIRQISKMKAIRIEGIFSHLSTADEADESFSLLQKERFDYMLGELEDVFAGCMRHLANDAGFINHDYTYDMVRSGISMYGIYPSAYVEKFKHIGLKSAIRWTSKVSNIKYIERGDSLSYGRTFIADSHMRIATVSVGYADGYKRLISNTGWVLIRGERARVLGNVTMDQMMVDVSNIRDLNLGDEVVLVGKSEEMEVSLDLMASWARTISYEIMTSISGRVTRKYLSN